MLPLASLRAPWAVSVIERCLSSWQLAQIGLSRPGTSRAGCCATAVREIAHRQEHSRLANVSNRIEHLPRAVHGDQHYPNRDPEVAAATNCRSATQIFFSAQVPNPGPRNLGSRPVLLRIGSIETDSHRGGFRLRLMESKRQPRY